MTGLLLVNLGTPDDPSPRAVRRYLRQFLSDPRVIDMNAVGRWLLLNLIILPFRPAKSAEAYRKIWTDRGSPLLLHSEALLGAVRATLGDGWRVELGMRYGNPSIGSALARLRDAAVERVVVLPLYPQYSSATTGSTIDEVSRAAAGLWVNPPLAIVPPFYEDPGYVAAVAAAGAPVISAERPDHVLFSFHGVPERHLTRVHSGHCLASPSCCDAVGAANRDCYRAQCFATARAIAARLELPAGRFGVSFQSRMGRIPWIQPFTDRVLGDLAAAGKKRLVVFSPAFVADCLETLEEIGLRGRDTFLAAGGESFALVPCLNSDPAWVETVATLARRAANPATLLGISRRSEIA